MVEGPRALALRGVRYRPLGAYPCPVTVVMWWTSGARTRVESGAAPHEWERGTRFGDVRGYAGPRLHAPALMNLAAPNPAS